ncbi:hypothetical protein J4E93_004095 [Alternaria ventricosa]|uniref:uncharacterized protein n=1 Tax=Alternaria ventricosa TaxID=1187951 RepID=UPI0020C27C55|nr:uncharacterized protein J4E93_004095 [Alternaria ventricosa]KAI4647685.1 hypothetical protein J4E93_004095 [Alternaria ventricosa]
MAGSIALTPSRKRAALATTDAPDAKKTPTFDIGGKDVVEDHDVNDRITARNATKSPLLRLPAELRNLIYACAFDNTTYNFFQDNKKTERTLYAELSTEDSMSLLLVSRQINAETAYLPYQLSTFNFMVYKSNKKQWKPYVRRFLARRSEEQIKAMSCLTVRRSIDEAEWRRSEQPESSRSSRFSQINLMGINAAVQYQSHFIFELSQISLEAIKSSDFRERSNA